MAYQVNLQHLLTQVTSSLPFLVVRKFLSPPGIKFMEFIGNGTLKEHIDGWDCNRPVISWMYRLSSTVTYLESFALAYGDIKLVSYNPQTIHSI